MAQDLKYGQVNLERGSIPDDEPVVVFRARDETLPALLETYYLLCKMSGSPRKHLDLVAQRRQEILAWQDDNPTQVPASANY
jgi:hypothetical protein